MPMQAAEEDFQAAGHSFRAGAFIIANADRAKLEPTLTELGLSGYAVAAVPGVKSHDLDVPRIGYVHSWQRTQDEGWVRAALDTYGVPYQYFADQKLQAGNLRSKYDVIIFNETLYYASQPTELVAEYAKFLNDGGLIIVSMCRFLHHPLMLWHKLAKRFHTIDSTVIKTHKGEQYNIKAITRRLPVAA